MIQNYQYMMPTVSAVYGVDRDINIIHNYDFISIIVNYIFYLKLNLTDL